MTVIHRDAVRRSGDTMTGLLQIGTPDTDNWLYNAGEGQRLEVARGTFAAPDTDALPMVKFSRVINNTIPGSGDGSDLFGAVTAICSTDSPSTAQPVGIWGGGYALGGSADAVGTYSVGWTSGTGVGIGFFANGARDNTSGSVSGAQINCQNETASDGTYDAAGFPNTNAVWLTATGGADSAAALAIGNPSGRQFLYGIAIPGQVTSGKTGGVKTASFRDDGNAVTVFDVNGSHTDILDTTGATISGKLFKITTPGTYSVSNGTTDRTYDADATSVDELADILATLIADLRSLGLVS